MIKRKERKKRRKEEEKKGRAYIEHGDDGVLGGVAEVKEGLHLLWTTVGWCSIPRNAAEDKSE